MADSINNLAVPSPKTFENATTVQQFPIIQPGIEIDAKALDSISKDIINMSSDKMSHGESDLLYLQFVNRLKEFLNTDEDATNAKSDIDDKLSQISSQLEKTSVLDKDKISKALSSSNIDETSETKESLQPDKLIDYDFIKQLANGILGSINLNAIVSTTVEYIASSIKSLIDGNANEFKKTLSNELNKGMGFSKLSNAKTDMIEDIVDTQEPTENNGDINPENIELPKVPKDENEPQEEQVELDSEDEKELDALKVGNDKESSKPKNEEVNQDELLKQQKAVDIQRKRKLLDVDKNLQNINSYLKKLIEKQDIVEEYKPGVEEEKEGEGSEEGKKSTKEKSEKESEKELLEEQDNSKENEEQDSGGRRFGKWMLIGSALSLLVLFRGYSSHASLQNYINKHANDKDVSSLNSDIEQDSKSEDALLNGVEKILGLSEKETKETDKEVDDIEKKLRDENKNLDKQDKETISSDANETNEDENLPQNLEEDLEETAKQLDESANFVQNEQGDFMADQIDESVSDSSNEEAKKEVQSALESKPNDVAEQVNESAESLRELNEKLEKDGDAVDEQNEELEKESKAMEDLGQETKDKDKENTEKIKETQDKSEDEAKKSAKETEKNQEESKKDADDANKKLEELKNSGDEQEKSIEEEKEKSEEDISNARNEEQENLKQTTDNIKFRIEEEEKAMEERDSELAESTVPRSEMDAADKAAEDVANDVENSTKDAFNVDSEINSEKKDAEEELNASEKEKQKNLEEQSKDVDSANRELESQSIDLEKNVQKLEESSEEGEKEESELKEVANDAVNIPEFVEDTYVENANKAAEKLFEEYDSANETNKAENVVLINRDELNLLYDELQIAKRQLAALVIQKSIEQDKPEIRYAATQIMNTKILTKA